MTAAWGLGQMMGPTFAGVLYDALGSYLVPSLLATAALAAATALTTSIWWSRRPAVTPPSFGPKRSGRIAELLACLAPAAFDPDEKDETRGPQRRARRTDIGDQPQEP